MTLKIKKYKIEAWKLNGAIDNQNSFDMKIQIDLDNQHTGLFWDQSDIDLIESELAEEIIDEFRVMIKQKIKEIAPYSIHEKQKSITKEQLNVLLNFIYSAEDMNNAVKDSVDYAKSLTEEFGLKLKEVKKILDVGT
jgi:hypothetical protein